MMLPEDGGGGGGGGGAHAHPTGGAVHDGDPLRPGF